MRTDAKVYVLTKSRTREILSVNPSLLAIVRHFDNSFDRLEAIRTLKEGPFKFKHGGVGYAIRAIKLGEFS